MAPPRQPEPVKLFVGMISGRVDLLGDARARLEALYGAVDAIGDVLDFDFTDYYEPEMGRGLKRQFLSFAEHIPPDRLAEIKLRTNALEEEIAAAAGADVSRPVNLDPGYLTLSKIVLATTKDHAHRIYLHDGIYAEVTLVFRAGAWQPWPWTYPDYATAPYLAFFTRVRDIYKREGQCSP